VEVKRRGCELAERLVDAIANRDANALTALFDDAAVLHHPLSPEPVRGTAAIGASEQARFDAFSDIDVEVRRVVWPRRRTWS
jgi:ketosteroid isomerase-like protein